MIDKKVKKYIELMYSVDSPLNKIASLDDRKKAACEKAGLDWENDQRIFLLMDKDVNKEIAVYLESHNPNEYIMLVSDQQLFWEMQHIKMEPLKHSDGTEVIDDDTRLKNMNLKTTISKNSEELLDRINRTTEKIYKTKEIIEAATEKLRLKRPEDRVVSKSE